jgi:hypothetical protein
MLQTFAPIARKLPWIWQIQLSCVRKSRLVHMWPNSCLCTDKASENVAKSCPTCDKVAPIVAKQLPSCGKRVLFHHYSGVWQRGATLAVRELSHRYTIYSLQCVVTRWIFLVVFATFWTLDLSVRFSFFVTSLSIADDVWMVSVASPLCFLYTEPFVYTVSFQSSFTSLSSLKAVPVAQLELAMS